MNRAENRPFRVVAKGDTATIWLYEEIGMFGITAKDFAGELQAASGAENITLRLNSPGGDAFQGLGIYNSLKKHPAKVTVEVDGIAASATALVAMAGDVITIAENALMMIHKPYGMAVGNSDDLRKYLEMMDTTEQQIINIHSKRTGQSESEVARMMNEETWMDSTEAVSLGFADSVFNEQRIAASAFRKEFHRELPKALEPKPDGPKESMKSISRELDIRIAEATL